MSSYTLSKRDVLAFGGLFFGTAIAGCTSLNSGPTKLVLHNSRTAEARTMVTVTNPDRSEPILNSEIETVSPGERVVVSDEIPRQNGHNVTVSIADGDPYPVEQLRWEDVDEPLHVVLRESEISFKFEPPE